MLAVRQVTEVPLVFDDAAESITKTSAAVKLLQAVSTRQLHSLLTLRLRRSRCM